MAKKRGKGKNPGTMNVTNPKRKKGKKKARKNPAKKKRRRNPNKGFIAKAFDKLGKDAALALPNLGGRYVGEVMSVAGAEYLGETIGGLAGTTAQVLAHIGLAHFGRNTPAWKQARIGLLSEAIHEVAVMQLGVDVPGMVVDMITPEAAPMTEEEAAAAAAGAGGLGALQDVKTTMTNRMAMASGYSI